MPQNLIRLSDFQRIGDRIRRRPAPSVSYSPAADPQCTSENCDGCRCQGETGHPGPHFLLGNVVNGCWGDDDPPPLRSA